MDVDVLVWREGGYYIIKSGLFGTVTQGRTLKEAIENFREAFELSLEDADFRRMVQGKEQNRPQLTGTSVLITVPSSSSISVVDQNAKASNPFWQTSDKSSL